MDASAILATAPLLERDTRFLWPDIVRRLPDYASAEALRTLEWFFLLGFACAARESLSAITASGPVVTSLITQAQLRADILGTIARKGPRPQDEPGTQAERLRATRRRALIALEKRQESARLLRQRRKRAAARKRRAAKVRK